MHDNGSGPVQLKQALCHPVATILQVTVSTLSCKANQIALHGKVFHSPHFASHTIIVCMAVAQGHVQTASQLCSPEDEEQKTTQPKTAIRFVVTRVSEPLSKQTQEHKH